MKRTCFTRTVPFLLAAALLAIASGAAQAEEVILPVRGQQAQETPLTLEAWFMQDSGALRSVLNLIRQVESVVTATATLAPQTASDIPLSPEES